MCVLSRCSLGFKLPGSICPVGRRHNKKIKNTLTKWVRMSLFLTGLILVWFACACLRVIAVSTRSGQWWMSIRSGSVTCSHAMTQSRQRSSLLLSGSGSLTAAKKLGLLHKPKENCLRISHAQFSYWIVTKNTFFIWFVARFENAACVNSILHRKQWLNHSLQAPGVVSQGWSHSSADKRWREKKCWIIIHESLLGENTPREQILLDCITVSCSRHWRALMSGLRVWFVTFRLKCFGNNSCSFVDVYLIFWRFDRSPED